MLTAKVPLPLAAKIPRALKTKMWRNCAIEKVARSGRVVGRGEELVKTIPCLFIRLYDDGGCLGAVNEIMPGCEWVARGEGWATEKVDGVPCAVIGGVLYKRIVAHYGKPIPSGAIPCQSSPDKVTGKWPHWFPVDNRAASDKWLVRALVHTPWLEEDGTYEAVGEHFKGNPYKLDEDYLEKHGRIRIKDCPRDYAGIREYLRTHDIEGIVWYRGNGDMCTITRKDFNYDWPIKRRANVHRSE